MKEKSIENNTDLQLLFLDGFHKSYQAKMGVFANYSMPFNYSLGLMKEHMHTRTSAGLFDLSHMGQVHVYGSKACAFLNTILPIPCDKLTIGKSRYTMLLNEKGGIIDDVIVTRKGEELFCIVINAACKEKDMTLFKTYVKEYSNVTIKLLVDRVLFALQGPLAESVLSDVLDNDVTTVNSLTFMKGDTLHFEGIPLWICRCGYTGEDGFEISAPNSIAKQLAETLIAKNEVALVGLGARNSLRLEAGFPLYGNDMDEGINVYEAQLSFAISKLRLNNADERYDFIGAKATRLAAKNPPTKIRVGIMPSGKAPIRENVLLYAHNNINPSPSDAIGEICSGGFSPSLQRPIAFAYLQYSYHKEATVLWADLRGKMVEVKVCALPFVSHNYKK